MSTPQPPAAESPETQDNAPILNALRVQFDRFRSELGAALEGSLGQAELELKRTTMSAVQRVQELERERERYTANLRQLESQVRERVSAFEQMERKFREELSSRDARIAELEQVHSQWEQKLQALATLRQQIETILR